MASCGAMSAAMILIAAALTVGNLPKEVRALLGKVVASLSGQITPARRSGRRGASRARGPGARAQARSPRKKPRTAEPASASAANSAWRRSAEYSAWKVACRPKGELTELPDADRLRFASLRSAAFQVRDELRRTTPDAGVAAPLPTVPAAAVSAASADGMDVEAAPRTPPRPKVVEVPRPSWAAIAATATPFGPADVPDVSWIPKVPVTPPLGRRRARVTSPPEKSAQRAAKSPDTPGVSRCAIPPASPPRAVQLFSKKFHFDKKSARPAASPLIAVSPQPARALLSELYLLPTPPAPSGSAGLTAHTAPPS
jgi:hypothetical protein